MPAPSRLDKLAKLVEQDPADPLAHFGLALELMNQERWGDAVARLQRTLEIDPAYTAAFFQKARAEMKLGQRETAAQTLNTGIRTATQRGDRHAADEMRKVLEALV
jgi:Tfp pilus assembly protein PilF